MVLVHSKEAFTIIAILKGEEEMNKIEQMLNLSIPVVI